MPTCSARGTRPGAPGPFDLDPARGERHLRALPHDDGFNDSSCASRRARLPWQVFAELMQRTLRPLATKRRHPTAFWRGWRLLAMDGTQLSLTNTPHIERSAKKAKSRRGRAAFAKIVTGMLLEVGPP